MKTELILGLDLWNLTEPQVWHMLASLGGWQVSTKNKTDGQDWVLCLRVQGCLHILSGDSFYEVGIKALHLLYRSGTDLHPHITHRVNHE